MKSQIDSLGKAIPAVSFAGIVLLCISSMVFAQATAQDAVPVLEGLDPVMLVQPYQETRGTSGQTWHHSCSWEGLVSEGDAAHR